MSRKAVVTDGGRDEAGRFAPGNVGGPGRPARATERVYLAALADAVTVDDWRAIAERAVNDAKQGNAGARDWLSKYCLGSTPLTLTRLAELEQLGVTPAIEVAAAVEEQLTPSDLDLIMADWGGESRVKRAMRIAQRGSGE